MRSFTDGQCIQEGIGIGSILVLEPFEIPEKKKAKAEESLECFDTAIAKATADLKDDMEDHADRLGDSLAIMEAHLMMLQDPEFIDAVHQKINEQQCTPEYATYEAAEEIASIFEGMDDEYFRERAQDIRAVAIKVINKIQKKDMIDLAAVDTNTIIVAKELLPNQAVVLNKRFIKGIAVSQAGMTSHTAIIAKTMGIPMITKLDPKFIDDTLNGKRAIIAAKEGTIHMDISEGVLLDEYKKKAKELEEERKFYEKFIGKQSLTKDGKEISIAANISLPNHVAQALENDADGVGLFRSEFLYMDRKTPPSLQEQIDAYSLVLKKMKEKPVIIRTMDIGGDKQLEYLNIPKEENPFLGLRAIRYNLQEKDMLRTQLSALLQASIHGNLHIMFPMVGTVKEIRALREILEEVKEELRDHKIDFKDVPIGIMIEIPAAAIISDKLAEEVDFFSIGTNDLIQYTLAVDRMNESVSHLYDFNNEAVLRLIEMTIRNGHEKGIWVGMCGDSAGKEDLVPRLIAMGIDELSVTPNKVLKIRYLASESTVD